MGRTPLDGINVQSSALQNIHEKVPSITERIATSLDIAKIVF